MKRYKNTSGHGQAIENWVLRQEIYIGSLTTNKTLLGSFFSEIIT